MQRWFWHDLSREHCEFVVHSGWQFGGEPMKFGWHEQAARLPFAWHILYGPHGDGTQGFVTTFGSSSTDFKDDLYNVRVDMLCNRRYVGAYVVLELNDIEPMDFQCILSDMYKLASGWSLDKWLVHRTNQYKDQYI